MGMVGGTGFAEYGGVRSIDTFGSPIPKTSSYSRANGSENHTPRRRRNSDASQWSMVTLSLCHPTSRAKILRGQY